jgi:adenosylcobalamin-dependent ribonucleoside-triphosphate reductase
MFKLSPLFLARYENQQPEWGFGDLSYFVFKRTYARLKEDGTQEEYFDTCRRVTEGVFSAQKAHCSSNRLPWNAYKAQKSAQEFFTRMWQFKFTPPGRGFWIMGTPMVDKVGSAALNNCGFTSTKDVSVDLGNSFAWAMDMLMLGVGIGFDTKGAGKVVIKKPKDKVEFYEIPDSREGWVESVYRKINSYMGGPTITYGYKLIRKRGAPIKGFGGTASGPEPLRQLHAAIDYILAPLVGTKITSVAIVDLMNYIGKCVVAGNVRRSAELAIGEIDDISYVTMKDYTKYGKEMDDRRWASNNSVFASRFSSFGTVAPSIALNGEPGLIFLDNARHYGRFKDGYHGFESDAYDNVDGFNPCAEQSLEDKELCCLVETYPANHESAEDYYRTLKFAYMYAKTVTLIPTHDERTNSVMMRNRRIGCSMSGIQQALKKFGLQRFLTDFCDKGYKVIGSLDRIYSRWLGVPRSVKMTTVKPSGTVSLLAGATPGVHCTHAEYYMRAIRVLGTNSMVERLLNSGYQVEYELRGHDLDTLRGILVASGYLEPNSTEQEANEWIISSFRDVRQDLVIFDKYRRAGGTVVVYFPVHEKNFTKSKFDISIWEQLTLVREMQNYWSDNSVSVTISVRDSERGDLERAIEYFAPYVKTLSFLPLENHAYDQAPYQAVDSETFEEYNASLLPLNFSGADQTEIKGSRFCTNDTCAI